MSGPVIAGRYRLDQLLGRGGMSEVWEATDLELGRRVALKGLAPGADLARFRREARAVAALAHPNVTKLYDYGEQDGRPFMVLECLLGGTLEDRLREREPLADEQTQEIVVEVAAGLAHAHARGVLHRDLKPSNVLFDEGGRAKLADFGIARLVSQDGTFTDAGTVLGTAAYISPEQAAGACATPASDVYSLGVVLFRMLTGRLPFEADDPLELVMLHRDLETPPVSAFREDAPPLLASAAAAALARDPRSRPPDGSALLVQLGVPNRNGLSSGTLSAAEVAQPTPPAGPPPTHRGGAPLLATALLVLLLAGAALSWEVTRPAHSSRPMSPTPSKTQTHRRQRTPSPMTTTGPRTTPAARTKPPTVRTTTTPPTTTRATTAHATKTSATPTPAPTPTPTTTPATTTATATTTPTAAPTTTSPTTTTTPTTTAASTTTTTSP